MNISSEIKSIFKNQNIIDLLDINSIEDSDLVTGSLDHSNNPKKDILVPFNINNSDNEKISLEDFNNLKSSIILFNSFLNDLETIEDYKSKVKIRSKDLIIPSENFVHDSLYNSDRNNIVLRNLSSIFNTGNLKGTGYLSILPVDQGIEHSGIKSFGVNPIYFNPDNLFELAIRGGCSAIASTLGILGSASRKYCDKIPMIVKLNHNESMTYPSKYKQTLFASVDQAFNMGAVGVGATIYYGSDCRDQICDISEAFEYAHSKGLFTILWTYSRYPKELNHSGYDINSDPIVTGQANYMGVTIQADIIKQKFPSFSNMFEKNDLLYNNLGNIRSKSIDKMFKDKFMLALDGNLNSNDFNIYYNSINSIRFQILNCFAGKQGLLNSGGASSNSYHGDFFYSISSAVINKLSGGMGIIAGRKVFQKSMDDGIRLLNSLQSIYQKNNIKVLK